MMLRPTRNANLGSSSCGSDSNQDRQEIPECQGGYGHGNKDREPPSGADEGKVATVVLGSCMPAAECQPLTIKNQMQGMLLRLRFSQTVIQKLVKDQGIDSPLTLASLSDENITVICDGTRRPGGLVSERMPDRWNQSSTLSQACHVHIHVDGMLLQT